MTTACDQCWARAAARARSRAETQAEAYRALRPGCPHGRPEPRPVWSRELGEETDEDGATWGLYAARMT